MPKKKTPTTLNETGLEKDYVPPDNLQDLFKDKVQGKEEESKAPKEIPHVELETDCFGGKRIKRKNEPVRPHEYPLPQNSSFCHSICVGGTGSGKSTTLLTLVMKYKTLSGVIICSLIEGLEIYKLIGDYCQEHGIRYYFETNAQDAYNQVVQEVENKKEGSHTFIVFDDAQTGKSMKSSSSTPENKVMLHLFSKSRNYNCSVCCMTQSYVTIPTPIRTNVNMMIYFKITNRSAIRVFKEDWCNMTGYSKGVIDELLKLTNEPHSYILTTNEPKVYSYVPSLYKEGTKLEPLQIQDIDEDEQTTGKGRKKADPYDVPFNALVKMVKEQPSYDNINMFRNYIHVLMKIKGYDPYSFFQTIKDKYDITLF